MKNLCGRLGAIPSEYYPFQVIHQGLYSLIIFVPLLLPKFTVIVENEV